MKWILLAFWREMANADTRMNDVHQNAVQKDLK